MSDTTVLIARCPEHGLHGQRTECFVCSGPVEQVPMVPRGELEAALAEVAQLRTELRRGREFGQLLRIACRDSGSPIVPARVAGAIRAVTQWAESPTPQSRPGTPDWITRLFHTTHYWVE